MIIALDLSLSCTGVALFDTKGKLIEVSQIVPPSSGFTQDKEIHYIVSKICEYFSSEVTEDVLIEDTYCMMSRIQSFKVLNRLAGAVIYATLEHLNIQPTFYTATSARKLVGIAPDIAKVETQMWVLERFYPDTSTEEFHKSKDSSRREYVKRKLTKNQYDYRLDKLSTEVAKATDLSNDKADAVIIGLAHFVKRKIIPRPK